MPCMYLSGIDSDSITYDDPENRCIRVNLDLFIRVLNNNELNTRAFLDTHLLKIQGNEDGQEHRTEKLVSKGNSSVGLGNMPSIPILVYTSQALITAEFRKMSSDDFKDRYLAPLDSALKESNICRRPLAQEYAYPLGDAIHVERVIQRYFNEIAIPIGGLFQDLGDKKNIFEYASFVRPPLDQKRTVQPDMIHMLTKPDLNTQYPEIVFGIGDYKTGVYKMTQGFEEFKTAILNRRRLRLNSIGTSFQIGSGRLKYYLPWFKANVSTKLFSVEPTGFLFQTTKHSQDSSSMK
ncbi:unnamed protein product [Debaryomyces tyrocola]|nr:unnamed protein product [Debaryomyces tyrocola]